MEVYDHDEKSNNTQIIGAYNSVGFVRDEKNEMEDLDEDGNQIPIGGDETCFLFNLTSNLRFQAIRDHSFIPYYSWVETKEV